MPNDTSPIIFLDFDGVICSPRAHCAQQSRWHGEQRWLAWADPIACDLVKRLCDEHRARLVISSTWRTMVGPCNQVLGRYDLFEHLHNDWRTNEARAEQAAGSLSRPWEINDWLSRNGDPEFIILDDDSFAWDGRQLDRWIQTDCQEGMSFAAFAKAEERLKAITA